MKKILRLVLALAILAGLWFLARYAASSGPARRHFAERIADALGADAATVESTTLEFPCTFVARGVKATLANPEATILETPEFRLRCCHWQAESPAVLAVTTPDGVIVPTFFAAEAARAALAGEGRPCPVAALAALADAWDAPSPWFSVRKADIAFRAPDGSVRPVFAGLSWTSRPIRLGKRGRVAYSAAKWTAFGSAVAPDGRPNSGRPAEAEWLGGHGVPVQPLWAPDAPCPRDPASARPRETGAPIQKPLPRTPRKPQAEESAADVPARLPDAPPSGPAAADALSAEPAAGTPAPESPATEPVAEPEAEPEATPAGAEVAP